MGHAGSSFDDPGDPGISRENQGARGVRGALSGLASFSLGSMPSLRSGRSRSSFSTLACLVAVAVSGCAESDRLDGQGGAGTDGGPATTSGQRPNEGGGGSSGAFTGAGGEGTQCAAAEICGNGLDDDCVGGADDGCECAPNDVQPCFSGDPAVVDIGECLAGEQTCDATGKWGLTCENEVLPSTELCDGLDNDCDDVVDNGFEPETCGMGVCQVTVPTCDAGTPQTCTPATPPDAVEDCDGFDDDCDGNVDEGCSCVNGTTQPCYTGAMGTQGVGPCKGGTQTCAAGQWGTCVGQVVPATEICDSIDQNCNGDTSEGTCSLANAQSSCSGGSCSVSSCNSGYSNCDSSMTNGCETRHTGWSNTAPGEDLGDWEADAYYGFGCGGGTCEGPVLTETGKRGRYFTIDALEESSCCSYMGMRFELIVPPGTDYDLHLTGTACFADPSFNSINGTGQNEIISVWCNDDCGGANNDFKVNVEVRHYSGASCTPWSLNVYRGGC